MMDTTIIDTLYGIHRRLAALEAQPRDYGTGELLYSSDLHTIMAVARREGCNLTELAADLGVSSPAAFKFCAKLLRLGYLTRERRGDNRKEVAFFLSEKGRRAERAHGDFERNSFGPLRELESRLPHPERRVILDFLGRLEKAYPL